MTMKRAVVLDRDGVMNDNREIVHVNNPSQLILFPDVPEAIRLLNHHGFLVLVATNQGGVGLGYLSEKALSQIHDEMLRQLSAHGAHVDAIAACMHAPRAGCACRKPRPGMLMDLQARFGFDFADSFMVGDRETDIQAGSAAGMRTIYLGQNASHAEHRSQNLMEAVSYILSED